MSYHHVDCNSQSFEWERKGEEKEKLPGTKLLRDDGEWQEKWEGQRTVTQTGNMKSEV